VIDYRALLKKYMECVSFAEGVTFVDHPDDREGFTDEEWALLQEIRKELNDE
jgi:hypothetical protein